MSQDALETSGSTEGVTRYLGLLLKYKLLIFLTFVVVLGAVAAWTLTRTPIYEATTSIVVEQSAPQVLGRKVSEVVDLNVGGYFQRKQYMATQQKIIGSRALAERVAEQLSLGTSEAFLAGRPAMTLKGAAKLLQASLSTSVPKGSNLLLITVMHSNRDLAAHLANVIASTYMSGSLDRKLSSTSSAVKWLSNQLDELKKQLEASELQLHQFKKSHNILSTSLEDKRSLISGGIQKLNDGLTDVRMKVMELGAERREMTRARKQDLLSVSISSVTSNVTISVLKQAYVDARRRREGLLQRYGPKHPVVLQQEARMASVRKDLEQETRVAFNTIESNYRAVLDRQRQLVAAVQQAKNEALAVAKLELDYRRLKRENQNTNKLYSLVLARMKEAELSGRLRVSNLRLLDAATPPKRPVRPRTMLNLLLGGVLGLLLGVGLSLLVDSLDSTVKSQADVEIYNIHLLGLLPRIAGSPASRKGGKRPAPNPERDLIVHRDPKSALAESCRSIRTNLLFASPDSKIKKILVTSPAPREGKTLTVVSMAVAMAQSGSRVLLVDTDMRRPRLHKVFGVPGQEGLSTILVGDGEIDKLVKTTEAPGLFILPCGPTPLNPAELCQSKRFREVLDDLASRYDYVFLDTPPVMPVTDAVILSTLVDGCLVVARTGQTSRAAYRQTTKQLTDVGAKVLGCVLNDIDLDRKGYGYYRYRGYGQYYRYGYYGEGDAKTSKAST